MEFLASWLYVLLSWYVVILFPSYLLSYTFMLSINERGWYMQCNDAPTFGMHLRGFIETGFDFLVFDHFWVHCPWSWTRAREARVEDARQSLPSWGVQHKTLGFLLPDDCNNPAMAERIAREYFESRTRFWLSRLWYIPISPLAAFVVCFGLFAKWIQYFADADSQR